MPTIATIDSIKILVYFDDHPPPHFHAEYNEHEEIFEILTFNTQKGKLPSNQRKKVLKWAMDNQDFLLRKWDQFNAI